MVLFLKPWSKFLSTKQALLVVFFSCFSPNVYEVLFTICVIAIKVMKFVEIITCLVSCRMGHGVQQI